MNWQTSYSSPENVVVETKIDDAAGVRNLTTLKRRGSLWFLPDDTMYVYYTPTHWRPTTPEPIAREKGECGEIGRVWESPLSI